MIVSVLYIKAVRVIAGEVCSFTLFCSKQTQVILQAYILDFTGTPEIYLTGKNPMLVNNASSSSFLCRRRRFPRYCMGFQILLLALVGLLMSTSIRFPTTGLRLVLVILNWDGLQVQTVRYGFKTT